MLIENLVNNLMIFDPIDRKIFGYKEDCEDPVNIAIKRNDLLEKINQMPSIDSKQFNVPLTSKSRHDLIMLFER